MTLIVVVDDRSTNREILKKLAQSLDQAVEVLAFADPETALAWTAQTPPDLIITDYKMPGLNGAEFTARVRAQPCGRDIPVMVVTAYEDRAYRYSALEAGATDFLLTPLDRMEFTARVRNLLTLRRQQKLIEKRAKALELRLHQDTRLHETKLQQSEEMFRLVINTLSAMVNAVDHEGRCVFVNNYQALFFDIDPDQAIGIPLEKVFDEHYARDHRDLNARVLSTGEPLTQLEETLTDREGCKRVFLTTKAPLHTAGAKAQNVVTVSTEITERKESERDLAQAKEAAEAANLAKTQFLANTSHELRTPLNAVIGFAEVMHGEQLGPMAHERYHQYAGDIASSGRHLLQIINELLDISRIEMNRLELHEEVVSLNKLLSETHRLLRNGASESGVDLQLDVPEEPLFMVLDPLRMRQVFVNLLSNAVKFTPSGGRVTLSARLLPPAAGRDERSNETPAGWLNGGARITIRDSGIGMSASEAKHARTPFGRAENALNSRLPGIGLGLPLAINLVELHGGHCEIDSVPDEGTTVHVLLPGERLSQPQDAQSPAFSSTGSPTPSGKQESDGRAETR